MSYQPKRKKVDKKSKYFEKQEGLGFTESRGIVELPDEREDVVMQGKPFISLPDGRIKFPHIDPSIPVLDGSLPVRPPRDVFETMKARGYRSTRVAKPVAVGGLTNLFVDGAECFVPINEAVSAVSDIAPKAPFLLGVVGAIGAGKTTTLLNLLSWLTVPGGWEKIVIGSKSLGADPILFSFLRSIKERGDDKIDVQIVPQITEEMLQDQQRKVANYYRPFFQLAQRGRTTNKPEDIDKYREMLLPKDPVWRPNVDQNGVQHGRENRFYDYSHQKRFENPWLSQDQFQVIQNPLQISSVTHLSEAKPLSSMNPTLWNIVRDTMLKSESYQTSMEQILLNNTKEKNKTAIINNTPPKPVLYIFEDAAYELKNQFEMLKMFSIIRHIHGSAICLVQKFNTIPTFIRTNMTDAIIFPCNNRRELDSMEEEFDGRIPDFIGKLHACTAPIPGGADRGFMYIRLRTGECFRNFEAKVDNVHEEPQKQ